MTDEKAVDPITALEAALRDMKTEHDAKADSGPQQFAKSADAGSFLFPKAKDKATARIEVLEAALREIKNGCRNYSDPWERMREIARAALAPEQDK